MLLALIGIMVKLYWSKRILLQPAQAGANNANQNRQKHLQKHMLILMLASVCIFFVTNLPLTISKITASKVKNVTASFMDVTSTWAIFSWIQSLNHAVSKNTPPRVHIERVPF